MIHKGIVACMTLALCLPASVLALYAPRPWPALETPASPVKARNFIRIELPPAGVARADASAERNTGTDLAAPEPAEAEATQEPDVQLANVASPPAAGPQQASQATASDGLLRLSFDISQPGLDRSSLDVRKGVRFNGADAGEATIRVGSGSALFIAREDLRTLLAAARRVDLAERLANGAEQPFVGFDEVRQKGLSLRYDAASDRILISG